MPYKDSRYNINYSKKAIWNIWPLLRKPNMMNWLIGLIWPVYDTQNNFLSFRDDIKYRMNIGPFACDIQRMLNDRYDITERRIRVEQSVQYRPIPFFLADENKPQRLFTSAEGNQMVLYTQSETTAYVVDFVVKVPVLVPFDNDEMASLVTIYKLESKSFKIVIV